MSQGPNGARACAQIDGFEIAYGRAGRGETLILLAPHPPRDDWHNLLAARYCVITPLDPAGALGRDPQALRGFMEALGLVRPRIVAHGSMSRAPLELWVEDGEALAALLIFCGAPGAAELSVLLDLPGSAGN